MPADETKNQTANLVAISAEAVFAENLRTLREDRGLSQTALADDMASRGFKWHQATVYKVEKGERQIQLGEARAVAEILGVPLDRMTEGTQNIVALSHLREDMREFARVSERLGDIYRLYEEVRGRIRRKVDADWYAKHPKFSQYNEEVVNMLGSDEKQKLLEAIAVDGIQYVRDTSPF